MGAASWTKGFLMLSIAVLMLSGMRAQGNPLSSFSLWPLPQRVEKAPGSAFGFDKLKFVKWTNVQHKQPLAGLYEHLPETDQLGSGVINFIISNEDRLPENEEGYELLMGSGHVTITARGDAGLFYGYQTLLQIAEEARDLSKEIPACVITDYPELPVRAVHLDLKHHLDAMHYYYGLMDRLAHLKINNVIIEFEDKLAYQRVPEIGTSQSVSIDEFAALSRYAMKRHIRISPLVQGLGHASFILKHERFASLRDDPASEWAFDPLNPETYKLQFALYQDAMAATPFGRFLHVGGDEVGELGKSARAKESGMAPFELQMHWLQQVCDFAKANDRIPIFWDDMVFDLVGLYQTTYDKGMGASTVDSLWQANKHRLDQHISSFPTACMYMRWNYDTPEVPGNIRAIDWYKANGLPVMAATGAQTFWPMMPRNKSNFEPIKEFCGLAGQKGLEGILCTAWDDSSPHFETFMRGIHTFAGMSWQHVDQSVEEVHARYAARFYGHYQRSGFSFQDELEEAMSYWETALVNSGTRNNAPRVVDLIDMPDQQDVGGWSNRHADRLRQARKEVERYASIDAALGQGLLDARRNHYSLRLFKAINQLQVYPALLLIALGEYDTALKKDDAALLETLGEFKIRRRIFEEAVSETRFLNNPEDYVVDNNVPNHLAAATSNSDWMHVFELAFNEKVSEWLN